MTSINKRRPGRPPGTSRNQAKDHAMLQRVAEMIVDDPSLRPTAAMRRLHAASDTELHRLRRKWRSSSYLAHAQARRRARMDGIEALVGFSQSLATTMQRIDPMALRRAVQAVTLVGRAVEQAAIGLVDTINRNPDLKRQIAQAGADVDRIYKQVGTGLVRVARENPELFRQLAGPSPAIPYLRY